MNLQSLALQRARQVGAIGVALIGAGKFGSMFLAQAPTMPGIAVRVIADLYPDRVAAKLADLGWAASHVEAVRVTNDIGAAVAGEDVDVVVEAPGDPIAGIAHAPRAIAAGKHLVMVTVEAYVLAGPALAARGPRALSTRWPMATSRH